MGFEGPSITLTADLVQKMIPFNGSAAIMVAAMCGNFIVNPMNALDVRAVKNHLVDTVLGRRDAAI